MWIKSVAPAEATGELRGLYQRIGGARGGVAQIHQVQSLNPAALAAHFEFYKTIMFQASPLSRGDREALAVAASRANSCEYCSAHHSSTLHQLGTSSTVGPEIIAWAVRLARSPERVSEADVKTLRDAGLSDRAILDAVLTVSYFAFANRLVMALGVELESGFEATCRPDITG